MLRGLLWGWRLARVERYLTPDMFGMVRCPSSRCAYVVVGCRGDNARPYLTRHLIEHLTGRVQAR